MKQLTPTIRSDGIATHVWKNPDREPTEHSAARLGALGTGVARLDSAVSTGVQGAAYEVMMDDVEAWQPTISGLDTPEGAYDRCRQVAADVTHHLEMAGYEAENVCVRGAQVDYPQSVEQWKKYEPEFLTHYVTRVVGDDGRAFYVDYTARQFEPDADFPMVMAADEYEARWDNVWAMDSQHRVTRTIKDDD